MSLLGSTITTTYVQCAELYEDQKLNRVYSKLPCTFDRFVELTPKQRPSDSGEVIQVRRYD